MPETIAEQFARDTASHEMQVLRDDGIYRHLLFRSVVTDKETGKRSRSSFYWFELVTWPGCLTINGDCGTFTFSRVTDMFGFFRSRYGINPPYWAEKVCGDTRTKSYSEDKFRQQVLEDFIQAVRNGGVPRGLGKAIRTDVLDAATLEIHYEDGARRVLDEFKHYASETDRYACGKQPDFEFTDTWEWDLQDWDWQYLWCCHAIQWGISVYDKQRDDDEAAACAERGEREALVHA
jgi:hypothetical protein